jgi:hypothetical protein
VSVVFIRTVEFLIGLPSLPVYLVGPIVQGGVHNNDGSRMQDHVIASFVISTTARQTKKLSSNSKNSILVLHRDKPKQRP